MATNLGSAYLESMVRECADAQLTHLHLETIAGAVVQKPNEKSQSIGMQSKPPVLLEMADLCMTAILTAAFWPVRWPNKMETIADFSPRFTPLPVEGKVVIVSIAFGVVDAIAQRNSMSEAEALAAMTIILDKGLSYKKSAVPKILRTLMDATKDQSSIKFSYITQGGKAASAFCNDPKDLAPLIQCGVSIRPLIEALE